MEVTDVLRRASSMALAIPRQLVGIANAGSIQNAGRAVRGADRRRQIKVALEDVEHQARKGSR